MAKIQQLMQQRLGLTERQLQPGKSLEEIGIDSLTIVEFMFDLEDNFGIRITDERTPVNTIQNIANMIDKAMPQLDRAKTEQDA